MRAKRWIRWAVTKPLVMVNLFGMLVILLFGIYLMVKPIDVLSNWTISLSTVKEYKEYKGDRLAVYHPGDSLVFTSKATKLIQANGITTRSIICYATDELPRKEIQLDSLPANKPVGEKRTSDNGVVVPEVSQFVNLPRVCYLNIDIGYENVVLWRDWAENARSEDFIVENQNLDAAAIRQQINDLSQRIKDLEAQLDATPVVVEQAPEAAVTPQPKAQPTPIAQTPPESQSDPIQPITPQPSILKTILSPITNLLGVN